MVSLKNLVLFFTLSLSLSFYAFDNYRIFPGNITQTETIITVHPTDPMIMFASAITINTTNGFKSEGVYVSTNGGLNWFGNDSCKGSPIFNHGGDPGIVIDKNGRFILTHIGSFFNGVYSHYSTDFGTTWSAASTLTTEQPEDKGTATTDNVSASPFYGRTYVAWVNFVSPFPVLNSYTTNGGSNWSTPLQINNPPPNRCSGGDIETGPNGEVYVAWAGVNSSSPFTEIYAGFGKSTNGGSSWLVTQNAYPMSGINGTLPQKGNIRVNGLPRLAVDLSGGARNGWLYIVTTEKNLAPAGTDPDIILHYSSDNGQSWSPGIRVNQDPLNDGKIQYFPAVNVDDNGGINIIYYDDRNTTSDSAEVYLSRSTDGGSLWRDYMISNHEFKPAPLIGGPSGYQGDFIGLTSKGIVLWPLWADNSSGIYQAWTTPINLTTIGIRQISNIIPVSSSLTQNYPNPFNPSTIISYQLSMFNNVSLKIYNALGSELATLVNEKQNPGSYSVEWNASDFASGIYFYTLEINGVKVDTKKMILIR